MTQSSKKNRIIFIDLLRAIAVLQMVQGHTVDVLLANDFRMTEFPVYNAWLFMRGMTAPIFMFTSGAVFTYLFRLVHQPFNENARVKKGLKRFGLLLFVGYAMKYPTSTIIDFSKVTADKWQNFVAVDVLQLIGTSLLIIIVLAFISEKTRLGDYKIFSAAAILFILIYPFTDSVQWTNYFPVPIASYFYRGTGSLFPLFPWSAYVISGAILGTYMAKNPNIFKTSKFSFKLFIAGLIMMGISLLGHLVWLYFVNPSYNFDFSINLVTLRVGFVLIINSVISLICISITTIPKIIILIGRNTLLIYVVHLVILFGSAWTPGLVLIMDKSMGVWSTVAFALLMLTLMMLMVIIINKLKIKNQQLVT